MTAAIHLSIHAYPTLRQGSKVPEVGRLQALLNEALRPGPHLAVDGDFGPKTLRAVRAFQAQQHLVVDNIVGPRTWAALERAHGRLGGGPPPPSVGGGVRHEIVQAALFGQAHASQIHYSQGLRRMEFVRLGLRPPRFPHYTDCSGFATWCYWVAGAPDPNGSRYNGQGFTGTMIQHGRSTSAPQPGDLAFYGHPIDHVAVVVSDRQVVSHGSEGGPYILAIRYRSDFNHFRTYLH
jgi:peptidoglycan hydrolase-like protein with peptidoglycan-binding domain